MANIRTGSIVSAISGSVSTETYARNQGGAYVKARTGPADNTGANRVACRDALIALAQAWSGTLTAQQRADWRAYAHQHPRKNKWGVPSLTNGQTRFIGSNFHRQRLDAAIPFTDAPTSPPLWQPMFNFTAVGATDVVTINLPPTTYSLPFAGLELFCYGGNNVNPGVNYYSSPWRYVARNKFNGAWTADPWTINYPLDLVAADKLFMKLIAQNSITGEVSRPFQTFALIG